ncbi:hypothetical protein Tco_0544392, partial [Tanacetum coccineum]
VFPCKVSHLVAVETLHLGLVISSYVTPIYYIYSPSRAVLITIPAILVTRSSVFPCKVFHLVAVEALHLGLVISSYVTPIDSDLFTSFLEKPYCPHAQQC